MSVDPGAQDLDGCESDKRTEGLALHDLGYVRMVAMGDARTTADDRPLACSQLGHDLPSRLPDRRNFFSKFSRTSDDDKSLTPNPPFDRAPLQRVGRRPLLVLSLSLLSLSTAVLGWAINHDRFGLASAGIIAFVVSFALGLGPVPFVLVGELPPKEVSRSASRGLSPSLIFFFFFFIFLEFFFPGARTPQVHEGSDMSSLGGRPGDSDGTTELAAAG